MPGHEVDLALLYLGFISLGFTDDVAILVLNVSVVVDFAANKCFGILTIHKTTDDFAILVNHHPILGDRLFFEAGEGTFGFLLLTTWDEFGSANDLAVVAPDLTFSIDLPTCQRRRVTFGNATEDGAMFVNNIALLVDDFAGQR